MRVKCLVQEQGQGLRAGLDTESLDLESSTEETLKPPRASPPDVRSYFLEFHTSCAVPCQVH